MIAFNIGALLLYDYTFAVKLFNRTSLKIVSMKMSYLKNNITLDFELLNLPPLDM